MLKILSTKKYSNRKIRRKNKLPYILIRIENIEII
jgi:hypothetical protein